MRFGLASMRWGEARTRTLADAGLITALSAVSLTWFREKSLLVGADTALPLNLGAGLDNYLYSPTWGVGFGGTDALKFPFMVPIGFALKLWGLVGLPYSAGAFERVLLFGLLLLSGLGMYVLIGVVRPGCSRGVRLLGACLYMFNFGALVMWGPLPLLLCQYAALPLILALYVAGVQECRGTVFAAVVALVWTLTATPGYLTAPYVLTNWAVITGFLAYHLAAGRRWDWKAVGFTVKLGALWVVLNAIWIVPLVALFRDHSAPITTLSADPGGLFRLNSVSVLDGMRFMGYWGLEETYRGSALYPWYAAYDNPLFTLASFVVPVAGIVAVFRRWKERHVLFFAAVLVVGLFLVKGPYPPFGSVNSFLFSRLNLDVFFRSTYARFIEYVVLALVVLAAFSLDDLWQWLGQRRRTLWRGGRKALYVCLFGLLVVALSYPLWTGTVFDSDGVLCSKRVDIPGYYYDAAEWLDGQAGDFNVLPLPFPTIGMSEFWWNSGEDGYGGAYPFLLLSAKRFLIHDFRDGAGSALAKAVIDGSAGDSRILGLYNIRYVIFHRDTNWHYLEGHEWWVSADPAQIDSSLKSMNGLSLAASFGELDVYENTGWQDCGGSGAEAGEGLRPLIYAADRLAPTDNLASMLEAVQGDAGAGGGQTVYLLGGAEDLAAGSLPRIEFARVNSSKYRVCVTGADGPFILVLSDLYTGHWKAYVDEYSEISRDVAVEYTGLGVVELQASQEFAPSDVKYALRTAVSEDRHLEVNGCANAWYIDPAELGVGGEFSITLYYQPQSLFYAGLLVSGLAFVMCGIVFLWHWRRSRRMREGSRAGSDGPG